MGGSAAHSIQAQAQHIWGYFTLRAGLDWTGVVERCDEGLGNVWVNKDRVNCSV
jgi:hypothetical protein